MKAEIDFTNKTIRILDDIKVEELFKLLEDNIDDYSEYTLLPRVETVKEYIYPYVQPYIQPYRQPYTQPFYTIVGTSLDIANN